jgi:hypothetical protein
MTTVAGRKLSLSLVPTVANSIREEIDGMGRTAARE